MTIIRDDGTWFLPAIVRGVIQWFPELRGRAFPATEMALSKENLPTLPFAVVMLVRSEANPPVSGRGMDRFEMTDIFTIGFYMKPERQLKQVGVQDSETPFWTYYPYEHIRDGLFGKLRRWQGPNGERVVFRGLTTEADPYAVTLTFTLAAIRHWCERETEFGDPITEAPIFGLCVPPSCVPDEPCPDPNPCEPCL